MIESISRERGGQVRVDEDKEDCTRLKIMNWITYLKGNKRVRVAERKLTKLHHWFQTLRQIEPGVRAMRSNSGLCKACKNWSELMKEK